VQLSYRCKGRIAGVSGRMQENVKGKKKTKKKQKKKTKIQIQIIPENQVKTVNTPLCREYISFQFLRLYRGDDDDDAGYNHWK
jgi:hypothetical protein